MKPLFEKLIVPDGAFWKLTHRILEKGIPFEWHYHPEFELTLTLNSEGYRFIGDHIEEYADGDLVLVGPNLPHTWKSSRRPNPKKPHEVIVMWFQQKWIASLTEILPELQPILPLLSRSVQGLAFPRETSRLVRPHALALPSKSPLERLSVLLAILAEIAQSANYRVLASLPRDLESPPNGSNDGERMERVTAWLHKNYARSVSIAELAKLACLTPSALCRAFKRSTQMTVGDYTARLRIGKACALLIERRYPIGYIAELVGYSNLANFNRQFRQEKNMTPREFQKLFPR